MEQPPIETSAPVLVHPRPHWRYVVLCALGALFLGVERFEVSPAVQLVVVLALVALYLLIGRRLLHPRAGVGAALIDEGGITLGDERISREAMRFATLVPEAPGSPAHLVIHGERRAPFVTIRVDAELGTRILSVLGIDAIAFKGGWGPRSAVTRWGMTLWVITLLLGLKAQGFLVGFGAATVAYSLWSWLTCPRIVVARDGIVVEWLQGLRSRFVPWSSVVAVQPVPSGVEVQRAQDAVLLPAAGEERDTLLERVEAQWAAYQAARASDLGALLARGGRDRETWLRALSANEGDFRTAPLAPEQLWSLVEGPGTPPTARAAAALVLARGAGDEDRRRLRIAATGCEHPRLRVVLDQAGRGVDEEVLGEALDGVEDEEEAPRVIGAVRWGDRSGPLG